MSHNFFEDNEQYNSWLKSSRNVVYSNNVLEAELKCCNGDWKYNKLGIHPLLVNKPLSNDNGTFRYSLSREDDDVIMSKFFPIYDGASMPFINIKQCIILSVNIAKYNDTRKETISILNNFKENEIFKIYLFRYFIILYRISFCEITSKMNYGFRFIFNKYFF